MRPTIRIRTRDRLLTAAALIGFLLICLAAAASRRPSQSSHPVDYGRPNASPTLARPEQRELAGRPPKPFALHAPGWLVTDLLWLIGALGLGAVIWLIVRFTPGLHRLRRPGRRRRPEEPEPAPPDLDRETRDRLARAFTDALADVGLGDGNRAIVACWIRLEQIAEEVGFARQSWETSTELVGRWLGGARLPAEPLDRLAALYREARYSGHAMPREQVELARGTLVELRRAFQPVGPVGGQLEPGYGGGDG